MLCMKQSFKLITLSAYHCSHCYFKPSARLSWNTRTVPHTPHLGRHEILPCLFHSSTLQQIFMPNHQCSISGMLHRHLTRLYNINYMNITHKQWTTCIRRPYEQIHPLTLSFSSFEVFPSPPSWCGMFYVHPPPPRTTTSPSSSIAKASSNLHHTKINHCFAARVSQSI